MMRQQPIFELNWVWVLIKKLMRNVILSASIEATQDEYQDIDLDNDQITVKIGGQYLINRLLRAKLDYVYEDNDAKGDVTQTGLGSAVFRDYESNSIMMSLIAER